MGKISYIAFIELSDSLGWIKSVEGTEYLLQSMQVAIIYLIPKGLHLQGNLQKNSYE